MKNSKILIATTLLTLTLTTGVVNAAPWSQSAVETIKQGQLINPIYITSCGGFSVVKSAELLNVKIPRWYKVRKGRSNVKRVQAMMLELDMNSRIVKTRKEIDTYTFNTGDIILKQGMINFFNHYQVVVRSNNKLVTVYDPIFNGLKTYKLQLFKNGTRAIVSYDGQVQHQAGRY